MGIHSLRQEFWVPQPADAVFLFFRDAKNLERIAPPGMRLRVEKQEPAEMEEGARIQYSLRIRGFPIHCLTEVQVWSPPNAVVHVQKKGPYRMWHHSLRLEDYAGGTKLVDEVQYALPLGWLGEALHSMFLRRDIEDVFEYRRSKVRELLAPSGG